MRLHRRPEIARFLAKAYETLQFKANKTAASAGEINELRVVQAGPSSWPRMHLQPCHRVVEQSLKTTDMLFFALAAWNGT